MNYSTTRTKSSKKTLSELFSSLCQYQLQKEYDTTLSLHEGDLGTAPVCVHHTKGRAHLPLWKALAFLGALAAFLAALRGIFTLFSLFSD